jgi:hypothetical protein
VGGCAASASTGTDDRRGERSGLGRLCHTCLFLGVLQRVDQHLGRAQIGTGRFVDQLGGDRLALGDLAAFAVDGHDHLLVERLDQQCRQVFRARSARVAGLAFLESGMHRRLAAADLVIALVLGDLVLGHRGLPFTRRGGGDTAARLPPRSSAPYARSVHNYHLANCRVSKISGRRRTAIQGFWLSLPVPCQAFDFCRTSWPSL